MARACEPPVAKLICGMISSSRELLDEAPVVLGEPFGPTDLLSEVMDFDFTDYYDREMGAPLYRRLVSFAGRFGPGALAQAKRTTNAIEKDFSRRASGSPARPINLDPGYVTQAAVVLASMKGFAHRIYLGDGVYGEVTLLAHKNRWEPLPWTFPDYASGRYDAFLTAVRDRLRAETRKETRS